MEEIYKLVKDYTIPLAVFRDAYTKFQKKYVFPKKTPFIIIFSIIAVVLILCGINTSKGEYAFYLAAFVCFALAAKIWYDPRKLRRSLCESVNALGEPVYRIGISESYIDISTVADDMSNVYDTDEEAEDDPLPEKTRLSFADGLKIEEYDKFFLIIPDNTSLYILPKEKFTETELEILRSIPKIVQGGKNAI